MALTAGDKLGPYEILGLIGAGGMGEVYRARDTKLKRDVALKVLPEAFASDPERMARFQREAEVLASLNHPNIAHLYGLEGNALVMELVEGQTLPCPLPIETALNCAKQIADALEYAHERGVVHRDLKPVNIKITPEGVVKVLDFGLAKAIDDPLPSADPSNSPTLTLGATRVGMILGTAAYMSPEQASGYPADRRADVWSFGAVFYEMLAGKRAFAGESVSDTLATVLKLDPDWNALPAETPASIVKLLRRCLTKDRKQRLQAIGEARIVIQETLNGSAVSQEVEAQATGPRRWLWPGIAAALAILVGVALWTPWRAEKPVDKPLVRLDVDLGPEISLPPNVAGPASFLRSVVISPDGTRLVYVASTPGGPPRLFTRRLDQSKATELPGTTGALGPFFSPDGQWVGFFADGKFNKISVEGGAVVPLTAAPGSAGASWGQDGSIILGGAVNAGLTRIPSGGGAPTKMTDRADGELAQADPQILPGGKAVLFVAYPTLSSDKAHVDVVTLADGHRKTLVPSGTSALYLATSSGAGHLVYTNKGTLFAIPFDPERLETHGTAVPILDDVAYNGAAGTAQFDVAGNGTLVYRRSSAAASPGMMTLQWLDATGKKEPLRAKAGAYSNPRLSSDGKRVAMEVTEESGRDIWVYDQQRDQMARLTSGGQTYNAPAWSPDGGYVFFGSVGNGIFRTRADGAGQPQPLIQINGIELPWSVAPDGKRLAYIEIPPQIWTVPLEETNGQMKGGKPEQFLKSQSQDATPEFSPDGRWLAYTSDATGTPEVYVRPFPLPASGQGGLSQISNSSGQLPMWSHTSHDLLYQSGDQIMAASYTVTGDSFQSAKPRVWLAKLGGATAFGLAPDGKRVAVMTPVETSEASKGDHEVVFLENFFDELRRRVPLPK